MQYYFAERVKNPIYFFFPALLPYPVISEAERRYGRNSEAVNGAILEMVQERRALRNAGKRAGEDEDVLDMLLSEELYQDNDLKVAMDIRGLFVAGDETCNITTANCLFYLAQHDEYRHKLFDEIMPTLEEASSDFVAKLSPDIVDEFVYTKQCVYETLRHCPSAPSTMPSMFNQDVTIGGVDFRARKTTFIVNMQAILNDPVQWIRPREFNPERFNPQSELYKRPDGKPRNPLAFCPFSGGKRICAGKTFAEIMLNITIPLIYFHFDFEFTDPQQRMNKPNYQLSAAKNPPMLFKLKQKRQVNI